MSDNRIKALRQKTGLSQSQFAKKYHITLSTLQHWEQGYRKCSDMNYSLLLRAVNESAVKIDWSAKMTKIYGFKRDFYNEVKNGIDNTHVLFLISQERQAKPSACIR